MPEPHGFGPDVHLPSHAQSSRGERIEPDSKGENVSTPISCVEVCTLHSPLNTVTTRGRKIAELEKTKTGRTFGSKHHTELRFFFTFTRRRFEWGRDRRTPGWWRTTNEKPPRAPPPAGEDEHARLWPLPPTRSASRYSPGCSAPPPRKPRSPGAGCRRSARRGETARPGRWPAPAEWGGGAGTPRKSLQRSSVCTRERRMKNVYIYAFETARRCYTRPGIGHVAQVLGESHVGRGDLLRYIHPPHNRTPRVRGTNDRRKMASLHDQYREEVTSSSRKFSASGTETATDRAN